MNRTTVFVFTILLTTCAVARAEHFAIDLTIQAAHDQATAHSDTDPSDSDHEHLSRLDLDIDPS